MLGFNYRLDEPRAALATARLQHLDEENAHRERLDARYRDRLVHAGLECALPPVPGLRSAHHLFCVVVNEDVDRDGFRAALAKARVQTSLHYPPAHRFAIYDQPGIELPITDAYGQRAVTLPLFAHMTDEQQDRVIDAAEVATSSLAA
jgi:dTDP-4-amino-4,6-dideoxygalactose transaminase